MLSIVLFDFFFVPPVYSLNVTVEQIPYFIVFISFACLVAWFSAVRRRVEQNLRQARDHLQIEVAERTQQASLLDLTHDSIFVRDTDFFITYWNKGAEELYGWSAQEALGKHSQELLQTEYPVPAVANIRAGLPISPVILWLSKGKVIVEQSFTNLSEGGKYHHLLGDFDVRTLAEHSIDDVAQASEGIIYFATVGTFNQRDKEEGTLLVHKADIDTAEQSTWAALRERLDSNSNRRPLIVVYDEAHNLTDQQTDLLLELEPDALIGASATMILPHRLAAEIHQLRISGRLRLIGGPRASSSFLLASSRPTTIVRSPVISSRLPSESSWPLLSVSSRIKLSNAFRSSFALPGQIKSL